MEIWKDIEGYPGYKASNHGNVKSFIRYKDGKMMSAFVNSNGYQAIHIQGRTKCVHRFIALCFCENPLNKPWVNHIDGNKRNNRSENLEWCTRQENLDHAHGLGLMRKAIGEKASKAKLIESDVIRIRKLYSSGLKRSTICKMYKMSYQNISSIVARETWTHI